MRTSEGSRANAWPIGQHRAAIPYLVRYDTWSLYSCCLTRLSVSAGSIALDLRLKSYKPRCLRVPALGELCWKVLCCVQTTSAPEVESLLPRRSGLRYFGYIRTFCNQLAGCGLAMTDCKKCENGWLVQYSDRKYITYATIDLTMIIPVRLISTAIVLWFATVRVPLLRTLA